MIISIKKKHISIYNTHNLFDKMFTTVDTRYNAVLWTHEITKQISTIQKHKT